MIWVVNKSDRAYNIGGVLLTPLVPTEIDENFLHNDRVKEIMADGSIEKCDNPATTAKTDSPDSNKQPESDDFPESGKRNDSDKQANDSLPPIPKRK